MGGKGTVNIISYASEYILAVATMRSREQDELIFSIRMLKFHTRIKLGNYKKERKSELALLGSSFLVCNP